jgi:hypothetical protein
MHQVVVCLGKLHPPCEMARRKILQQLVEDCQPATIGFEGKNVLDEKIRKAGKLEASQFSTSFNPYDVGIVNTVAQAIVAGIIRPAFQDMNISTGVRNGTVIASHPSTLNPISCRLLPSTELIPHELSLFTKAVWRDVLVSSLLCVLCEFVRGTLLGEVLMSLS